MPSASPDTAAAPSRSIRYRLGVNTYDRTATLIIASLLLLGAAVGGLAIVFFANKFTVVIEPIAFVPVEATSPNANQGFAEEPEPPGAQDAAELAEPALLETLNALMDPNSISEALFANEASDAVDVAGEGQGLGDRRQAGPGGDGVVERVPRWQRWKIRFDPRSEADFAAWLDQFGIRVAVVGYSDNKVHVAWNFHDGAMQQESVPAANYASWGQTLPADGPMPRLTQNLAREAGIANRGAIVLLFFPQQVEFRLYNLERDANQYKDANKVRETIFNVTGKTGSYDFEVVDIKYF